MNNKRRRGVVCLVMGKIEKYDGLFIYIFSKRIKNKK